MPDNPIASAPAPHPKELVLRALTAAVEVTSNTDDDTSSIVDGLGKFFITTLPSAPGKEDLPDICSTPDPNKARVVAPFCSTLQFQLDSARTKYETKLSEARHNFNTAVSNWTLANSQYKLAVAKADQAYQGAANTAKTAFSGKTNDDSGSRQKNLYYQMEITVSGALLAFEGQMAAAGGDLATAAGTLINAYLTYVTTVGTAASQQIADRASALGAFWSDVEGGLDVL